jgi:methyl-accepting chemotaxis protein
LNFIHSLLRQTDIMGEITAASQEQSKGIGQINQAVTQMDEVTQQNAALVEEAAAAASSLESQVADLRASVSMFRLDVSLDVGVERAAARARVAAPVPIKAPARLALKQSAPHKPVRVAQTAKAEEWGSF